MRFSIGFVVGLLIGIAATAAYYELVGSEPNEITEPAKSGSNACDRIWHTTSAGREHQAVRYMKESVSRTTAKKPRGA